MQQDGKVIIKALAEIRRGQNQGKIHGVTLGSVDDDAGVEINMHIFVGSKAPWDHIGGNAPQFAEFPPQGT